MPGVPPSSCLYSCVSLNVTFVAFIVPFRAAKRFLARMYSQVNFQLGRGFATFPAELAQILPTTSSLYYLQIFISLLHSTFKKPS